MTAATRKALDLYPSPPEYVPANGVPTERLSVERQRVISRMILLRSSLLSDEWPRMVRAFTVAMHMDRPTEPTPLDNAALTEHAERIYREVGDLTRAHTVLKQADEFIDIIYLALRGLTGLGLTDNQINAGFTECHAANMTKVLDDGRPLINDGIIAPDEPLGKVLKTNNYVAPDYAAAMGISDE